MVVVVPCCQVGQGGDDCGGSGVCGGDGAVGRGGGNRVVG